LTCFAWIKIVCRHVSRRRILITNITRLSTRRCAGGIIVCRRVRMHIHTVYTAFSANIVSNCRHTYNHSVVSRTTQYVTWHGTCICNQHCVVSTVSIHRKLTVRGHYFSVGHYDDVVSTVSIYPIGLSFNDDTIIAARSADPSAYDTTWFYPQTLTSSDCLGPDRPCHDFATSCCTRRRRRMTRKVGWQIARVARGCCTRHLDAHQLTV